MGSQCCKGTKPAKSPEGKKKKEIHVQDNPGFTEDEEKGMELSVTYCFFQFYLKIWRKKV